MDNFDSMQSEKLELFKRAISEAMDLKIQEIDEQIRGVELPSLSKEYKAQIEPQLCEHNHGSVHSFPEQDNIKKHEKL